MEQGDLASTVQKRDDRKTPSEGFQNPERTQGVELNSERTTVIYTAADGKVTADVFFAIDTFWMTQKTMAGLFGVKIPAISKHLKNIYISGELTEKATISKMETVQTEGARQISRTIDVYNLDAAIAVGYRVNSIKATHFRLS